jgi:hypothetical protein
MRGTSPGNHRGTGEVPPPPPRPHFPPPTSTNTHRGNTPTHPNTPPKPHKRRPSPHRRTPPPNHPTDPAGSPPHTTAPPGNRDQHRPARPRPRGNERRTRVPTQRSVKPPRPSATALPHQPVHAETGSHPQPTTPLTPTHDAWPPPPGTIPPGVDPSDWERNLRRVLEGMPRTINPASARILADLLATDRTHHQPGEERRPPTTSPRAD